MLKSERISLIILATIIMLTCLFTAIRTKPSGNTCVMDPMMDSVAYAIENHHAIRKDTADSVRRHGRSGRRQDRPKAEPSPRDYRGEVVPYSAR